jgi:type I restriction enzyme, S subunit
MKQLLFDREVPYGWQVLKVDQIRSPEPHSCVAGPFGSSISSKFFVPEGVPVIRGSSLRDDLTRFVPEGFVFVSPEQAKRYKAQHVRAGDLVFTCWGTLGQVGLIPKNGPYEEYVISNKQLKLRPNPAIADATFLFYYFASPQMVSHIRSIAIGAAVPGINLGLLKGIDVTLPPLAVQHRIADILSAYDGLIENNTRRIKILEQMAQMLYREWFVNFRFPGHEQVKMVESEMGLIPAGWTAKKLGDVLRLEYGKALKADQRTGGGVPVFGSSGVVGYHSEMLTQGPGIVVGRKGNVGSVFYCECDFWVIDTAYYVSTSMPLHYIYFNLLTQNFLNNDAAVPGLNRNQAHSLPIVVPETKTLQEFGNLVAPLFTMHNCLEKRNSNLRTTRDLLLPKLVSGEVNVNDIEVPETESVTA